LQNIVKHSSATEAIIQLSEHDETINLVVEDNGKGFNPELWEKSTGMGFSNLKNRVNYLKGNIQVNTQPGEGCSFLVEFKRKT
jgi:two-component system NarL family sensor kinase